MMMTESLPNGLTERLACKVLNLCRNTVRSVRQRLSFIGPQEPGGTDKWRVAYDVISVGPFCFSRVVVPINDGSPSFIGNELASRLAHLHADAIPDCHRLSMFIQLRFPTVVFDQRIPALNVFQVPQDGLREVQSVV